MMMNRFTNKYSYGRNDTVNTNVRVLGERVRNTLLVLLVVTVVVLAVVGGQAIAYRSKCEPTFIHRMMTECDEALNAANDLSRSGGSASSATLGKIRANVHAIDVINNINNTVEGGNAYFIQPDVFSGLYSVIDSYSNNLRLGNVTIENLDNLVNGLEQLKAQLTSLK